ncbi:MAG TPA: hypothetical protein VMW64_10110 [Dehalococcoidia bacterium]|nr:hypothetical protein [Dehalococcoidia bacterium]
MAKIDSISFGSIVVDGKNYRRDVFLFPDGSMKQRKGGFRIFGGHNIKRQELENTLKSRCGGMLNRYTEYECFFERHN